MRELAIEEVELVTGGFSPGEDGPSGVLREPSRTDFRGAMTKIGTGGVPATIDAVAAQRIGSMAVGAAIGGPVGAVIGFGIGTGFGLATMGDDRKRDPRAQ